MSKCNFISGIITGMAVGVGAAVFLNQIDDKDKKRIKKNATQMFTTLGAIADHAIDMYK